MSLKWLTLRGQPHCRTSGNDGQLEILLRDVEGQVCRGRFETGTYQREALPDFPSAGFRKTLCRLLDILGGVGGAHIQESEQCGAEVSKA